MALLDWEIYPFISVTTQYSFVALDFATPVVGSGSLHHVNLTGSIAGGFNAIPTDASGFPHGKINGRLRTLVRWDVFPGVSAPSIAGCVFMQSQNDLMNTGGGNYYFFGLRTYENWSQPSELVLRKVVGDRLYVAAFGDSGSNISLETIDVDALLGTTITTGTVVALEVDWVVDVAQTGGIYIIGKVGLQTDFSDLGVAFTHIDFNSPFVTTVAEGLGLAIRHASAGLVKEVVFDQTTMYELV
jgi:hypothetical protein